MAGHHATSLRSSHVSPSGWVMHQQKDLAVESSLLRIQENNMWEPPDEAGARTSWASPAQHVEHWRVKSSTPNHRSQGTSGGEIGPVHLRTEKPVSRRRIGEAL
mmetsp:Transcript_43618/g.132763  ORF Transcript_43618/g.132763 Transcript_43618/m.132763 type:complete len:104 (+) Transcript_43618:1113-1424(+)